MCYEDISLEDNKRLVKEAIVYPIKGATAARHPGISAASPVFDSEYISFKGLEEKEGSGSG